MTPETFILMMANGRMGDISMWLIGYFIIKMLMDNYDRIRKIVKKLFKKKSTDYIDLYKYTNRNNAKSENEPIEINKNILAISYYIKNTIKDIKELQIINLENQIDIIYLPANGDKVKLNDTITLISEYISSENDKKDTSVETIRVELLSSKSREDLTAFSKQILQDYEDNRMCLDNDDIIQLSADGMGINDIQIPFKTDKTFDNLFFRQKDDLITRLTAFKSSNIYSKLGIQRSLGLLFSGEPGTGKTSTIKAIAKHLGYHIIPIQINKYMTRKRLNRIFQALNMGTCHNDIQYNKRLYLFEEIDCNEWADIVKARKYTIPGSIPGSINGAVPGCVPSTIPGQIDSTSTTTSFDNISHIVATKDGVDNKNNDNDEIMSDSSSDDGLHGGHKFNRKKLRDSIETDKVTLGTLLELMDGLIEFPGRMIIMTTNHPEVLDPALLRPGRIDMHIHFGRLRAIDIADIYKVWTGIQVSEADIARIPNEVLTQAELSQLIFKYEFCPEKLLEYLYSSKSATSFTTDAVEIEDKRIKAD